MIPYQLTKPVAALPLSVLIVLFTISSSCTHVYYAPNTVHAPLLSAKHETRINALYSFGENSEFNGGEVQVAHAVSNKIALMVNYFAAGKEENISEIGFTDPYNAPSHIEKGQGSYAEIAGGYFSAFSTNKKWTGELYAGYGFGSVTNDYGFDDYSKVGITKFFLQPAIGFKSKNFEAAFVPKLSRVNWRVLKNNIRGTYNSSAIEDLKSITSHPGFMVFEPGLLIRCGSAGIKFQFALSFSNFRLLPLVDVDNLHENLTGSLGVSINIKRDRK